MFNSKEDKKGETGVKDAWDKWEINSKMDKYTLYKINNNIKCKWIKYSH